MRQKTARAEGTTRTTEPGREPVEGPPAWLFEPPPAEPPPWLTEPPSLEPTPDPALPEPPEWLDAPDGRGRPGDLAPARGRNPGTRSPAPRPRGGAARAASERLPRLGPP